jgi:hypothetical protein
VQPNYSKILGQIVTKLMIPAVRLAMCNIINTRFIPTVTLLCLISTAAMAALKGVMVWLRRTEEADLHVES